MADYRDTGLELNALDRGGAVRNVRAFGVTGDGVTEESAAIQTVLTAATAGDTVLCPPGTYLCDTALDIPDGVTLEIASGATIKADATLTLPFITSSNTTEVCIRGPGTIDCSDLGSDDFTAAVELTSCTRPRIEGVSIINIVDMAVHLDTCTDGVVSGCRMREASAGVWMTDGSGHVVSGNVITRTDTPGDAGSTSVRGIRGSGCTDLTISGNKVERYDMGVEVWGGCDGSTISGNTLIGPWGVSVDRSDYCSVTGNTIRGIEGLLRFADGVELAQSVGCSVTGNVIFIQSTATTGVREGIHIGGSGASLTGSDHATVSGNTVVGGLYGFFWALGDHLNITGNTFKGQTTAGVFVVSTAADPVDDVTIVGNSVYGSGSRGIYVALNRGLIEGNSVFGSAERGIYVGGLAITGSRVVVKNNLLADNTGGGIILNNVPTGCTIELLFNTSGATLNNAVADTVGGTTGGTIRGDWMFDGFRSFADGDTSPSVMRSASFRTANTTATTITTLDDGYVGQRVWIQFNDANTTVDCTSPGTFRISGRVTDWTPAVGDWMVCHYDGSLWRCVTSEFAVLSDFNTFTAAQVFQASGAAIVVKSSGDTNNRIQILDTGTMQFGSGSAATDTNVSRRAAGVWGSSDSTSLQAGSGAWDGGHFRMGNYHLWVDSTGDLRIKNGAPSGDTDGAVVGTQT